VSPAPAQAPPAPLVELELLGRVQGMAGQLWLPGERAGFAQSIAADLVERGLARRVPAKAPAGPDRDKMMRETTVQKK